MRDIDLVTKRARDWLAALQKAGGDPDAPEALFWKEKIAQAEEGAADDAANRAAYSQDSRQT